MKIKLNAQGSHMMVASGGSFLELVGSRPMSRPYIWIGVENGLYGTIENPRTLRALAKQILKALGEEPK